MSDMKPKKKYPLPADEMYLHIRVGRDYYEQFKAICKSCGETASSNVRRYMYSTVEASKKKQLEEMRIRKEIKELEKLE